MPTTRTMTVVTLIPAVSRNAYPEHGGHKIEVQYMDIATSRKHADAWAVLDSDDKILGVLFKWGDGDWSWNGARNPHTMPADTSHMSVAQYDHWFATVLADETVLRMGDDEDREREEDYVSGRTKKPYPRTRRTLLGSGHSPPGLKTKAAALAVHNMVLA